MREANAANRSVPSVVGRVKGRSPAHLALDIMVLEIIKTAELVIGHGDSAVFRGPKLRLVLLWKLAEDLICCAAGVRIPNSSPSGE